jgi:hypothetical protein
MSEIEERLVSRNLTLLPRGRVKVLYTDLDGTMLGRNGSFFHDARGEPTFEPAEALMAARAAGIDVVPTSGRSLFGLVRDARILGLSTAIAEMGALIAYDTGREIVRGYGPMPDGESESPVATMQRTGAIDLLLDTYRGRLEPHTPWTAYRECTQIFRGLVDVDDANALLERAGHGWVVLADNGTLGGPQPQLGLGPGESHVYHLMPRGTSKGTAVAIDRERRGFAREECVAIGDAVADLEIAPRVAVLVVVRDALEDDPDLRMRALALDNVLVTDRPMNLGWADTVRALLA